MRFVAVAVLLVACGDVQPHEVVPDAGDTTDAGHVEDFFAAYQVTPQVLSPGGGALAVRFDHVVSDPFGCLQPSGWGYDEIVIPESGTYTIESHVTVADVEPGDGIRVHLTIDPDDQGDSLTCEHGGKTGDVSCRIETTLHLGRGARLRVGSIWNLSPTAYATLPGESTTFIRVRRLD